MKQFPKQIYVRIDGDVGEEYFLVELKPDDFAVTNAKQRAAVYRLDHLVDVSAKTTVSVLKKR